VRAFLAIPVLPPALEPLTSLRERLAAAVGEVRWAPPDSPHITVHFFGEIGAVDASRALALLEPVVTVQPFIELRLCGLGAFPSDALPRVLWCGVDDESAALHALAGRCAAVLAGAGFAVEGRAYRPHCTLGRPHRSWPAAAHQAWRALAAQQPCTPHFVATTALLYESVSGAGGIRHLPRAELRLRG
jgi:2'-5' RNA ligase